MKLFSWLEGRQQGTEYKKFCFLFCKIGHLGLDGYILRYEPNTTLPPHRDTIDGKHYRLNIEIYGRGDFISEKIIFSVFKKIYLFRPDISTHSVVNHSTKRYVLSFGVAFFD
ncbi:MAG: hypothetical protein RI935_68 [Candidatus Parcubacteria bacterium]|jgi:hypothetical protein